MSPLDPFDLIPPREQPAVLKPRRLSHKKKRTPVGKELRLHCLELAATGYYDSPQETLTRAASYERYVRYGNAFPRNKGRKTNGRIQPRKAKKPVR